MTRLIILVHARFMIWWLELWIF